MPTLTIPLIGQETRRGLGFSASSSKDQYFGGCIFTKNSNPAAKTANFYAEKRPGIGTEGTITAGNIGTAVWPSPSTTHIITAYGGSNSTIFDGATSAGTITGGCNHITEVQYSGVTYYLLTSSDGTGWYLVNGAISQTSYTGDTHSNTVVDNIASTAGMYVGQAITGSGFQAGTRIASITSSVAITITLATSSSLSATTLTKTPIAKIISANFPSVVGGFTSIDGYAIVITSTGRVYNSGINDINTWSSDNFISANIATDQGIDVIQYKNHIIAFGSTSIEFFYNAGNPSGSILSSRKELFRNVGIYPSGATPKVSIINDDVYWIGNDFCLYTFDGLEPTKISPEGIKLGTTSNPVNIISGFRCGVDTIVHLGCTNSVADDKWYSKVAGSFFEPNLGIASAIFSNIQNPTSTIIAEMVSGTNTSGILYNINTSLYQDVGSAFTMTIQTEPYYLNNGLPFVIDNITLLADTQSSGSSTLSSTGDDYATFQTIGPFDLTQQQKNLSGGGYYDSSVAFKLTDSGNNAWRGQALKIVWRPYQ